MIKKFFEENNSTLDLYTLAITKAHGKRHPEVFEVRKIYEIIQAKVKDGNTDLSVEFSKLRVVTNNYLIPVDVCETFTKTYKMIEQFDTVFHSK